MSYINNEDYTELLPIAKLLSQISIDYPNIDGPKNDYLIYNCSFLVLISQINIFLSLLPLIIVLLSIYLTLNILLLCPLFIPFSLLYLHFIIYYS